VTEQQIDEVESESIDCSRYLRFSVLRMFTASWMPKKTLVEIT
jgi:hypothetical protein